MIGTISATSTRHSIQRSRSIFGRKSINFGAVFSAETNPDHRNARFLLSDDFHGSRQTKYPLQRVFGQKKIEVFFCLGSIEKALLRECGSVGRNSFVKPETLHYFYDVNYPAHLGSVPQLVVALSRGKHCEVPGSRLHSSLGAQLEATGTERPLELFERTRGRFWTRAPTCSTFFIAWVFYQNLYTCKYVYRF